MVESFQLKLPNDLPNNNNNNNNFLKRQNGSSTFLLISDYFKCEWIKLSNQKAEIEGAWVAQ